MYAGPEKRKQKSVAPVLEVGAGMLWSPGAVEREMAMSVSYSGGCLCGAIRYTCSSEAKFAGHCQCRDCQYATGGGHGSYFGVPEADFSVSGRQQVYESRSARDTTVSRGFCPVCGSPLTFRSSGAPGIVFVAAGSLDDPSLFHPQHVLFAASAQPWDHTDPSLRHFPGRPTD